MSVLPTDQLDLFFTIATDAPPKEAQDLMSRNWFNLSKRKRIEPIEHKFGDQFIKIEGDERYGIATIYDNDFLIFMTAQYVEAMNSGLPTSRTFAFTGYEYFTFLGKKRLSGKGYKDLWASLQRLHHTFIETNIRQGDSLRHHSFNLLSEVKQTIEDGKHRGYEVVVPEWFYDTITKHKNVLTLDPRYFELKGGIERFLYMYARKSAGGNDNGWSEPLNRLYIKSGVKSSRSDFKRQVIRAIEEGKIPEYNINEYSDRRNNGFHFERKIPLSRKRRG
jgi:plasmid replication initiation protein